MNQLTAAHEVIEIITDWGFDALIVGGAVRDLILGHEPHDVDICTNCPLDRIESNWPSHDIGKSKDFGIVTIEHSGFNFEVANFRTESTSSDGRRPDEVKVAETFEEDASRRDFTFNALALDVNGNIIDLFGGRGHLETGVLVTVGVPSQRFEEDFLRIIRAVRFSARLGLHIECETEKAMMNGVRNLPKLSAERIKDELFKMASMGGKKFAHSIETMNALGILDIILPEVAALKNFNESPEWHPEAWAFGTGTTFDHVMQALRRSQSNDALTNMAILLHDVGKGVTHNFDEERQKHTFHGHDMAAVPLVNRIAKRLKFATDERDAILFACTKHMQMGNKEMRATKITALVTDANWELLKHVSFADNSAMLEIFNKDRFDENIKFFEDTAAKWSTDNKPMKIVDGNMVMEMFSLKPSKAVGDIIRRVTELVVDEGRTDPIEALIREVWNVMN